jgi:F-type H+-transporting ATPase subunit delta
MSDRDKNKIKKQEDVEVISAVKLDDKTISTIEKKISSKLNMKVSINNIIDQSILGGIIIHVQDYVIDLSLKGKLEGLKENLESIDLRG